MNRVIARIARLAWICFVCQRGNPAGSGGCTYSDCPTVG